MLGPSRTRGRNFTSLNSKLPSDAVRLLAESSTLWGYLYRILHTLPPALWRRDQIKMLKWKNLSILEVLFGRALVLTGVNFGRSSVYGIAELEFARFALFATVVSMPHTCAVYFRMHSIGVQDTGECYRREGGVDF